MSITIRHHIPGRTRLGLPRWPEASRLEAARAALADDGIAIASANPHSLSVLLRHPAGLPAAHVMARFAAALAGDCATGSAPDRVPRRATRAPEAARQPADPAPGAHGAEDRRAEDRRAEAEQSGDPTPEDPAIAAFSAASVDSLLRETGSAPTGLSAAEAASRLAIHGPNAMPALKGRSRREMLLGQVATLPVALLVGSAVLSVATGGLFEALVTIGVVAVNAAIGFSSENATEKLVRHLSRPVEHVTTILRDGTAEIIPARDVVPGDVILLAPGGFVPADARLIEASELSIDESLLTGESLPVLKSAAPLAEPPRHVGARANLVHAGTIVTGGSGRAVAIRTGGGTEMARTRAMIGTARPPRPAIEGKLEALAKKSVFVCLGASALVLGAGFLRGEPIAAVLRGAIALAVAAIPEGLPAVATTTLALGAREMEREKVFVRSLPAVEAIGGVDTICLDKTGTLTENRMAVTEAALGGTLLAPDGESLWPEAARPGLTALAEIVALCNEADRDAGIGSATEIALLDFAVRMGLDVAAIRAASPIRELWSRNHQRRWMASAHARDGATLLAVKGAPEEVLALSTAEWVEGAARPLTVERRAVILEANAALARRGLRVLGVARCERPGGISGESVADLVWLGLVGLADPVRSEAREALDIFHRAGVRTIMLTGDQPETAYAVAESLALSRTGIIPVVDGAMLAGLDDAALGALALRTSVFARVSPADKLRIVRALQGAGRRVAMIGDGVNDGPALRIAAVGVAMGKGGTDVAREVADVVIAEDDLRQLALAIARGRATEDNVRASLRYFFATNLSEVLVMLGESLHGRGELETPMELFWLNLVTDVLPALGLALAEPSGDVMARAPRAPDAPLLDGREIGDLVGDAAVIGGVTLAAHFIEMARAGLGPSMRTSAFLTLALAQVAHAWVLRDRAPTSPEALIRSRRRLEGTLVASMGLLTLPFLFRPLQGLLGIAPLTGRAAGLAFGLSALSFGVNEGRRLMASARAGRAGKPRPGSAPARTSPPLLPARTG